MKKSSAPGPSGAAEEKLAASGLDLQDAVLLGIDVLDAAATAALGQPAVASLRLNYFNPDESPLVDPVTGAFWRLRFLGALPGFAGKTEGGPRYVQPAKSLPHVYYPKNVEWGPLLDNVDEPIIITEGELKAACACKHGCPTIGLGGVHNWRALSKGIDWCADLKHVKWQGRFTYICFDSDYQTNPLVCGALREFAAELERRGAATRLVTLPTLVVEGKTGLDDYIQHPDGGIERFRQLLHAAEPLGLASVLFDFNERYIYIRNPGLLFSIRDRRKVAPEVFKGHLESPSRYIETVLRPDGTLAHKSVSAASRWLSWPIRREGSRLTYAPGRSFVLDSGEVNLWEGWGVEPEKGDGHKLFQELLAHIFQGAEPGALDWFLDWLAYPLQHPGTKLYTCSVIHGVQHGTGKTFIGYIMGKIYGKNYTEIHPREIQGGFNEWAEAKQFALGDDITSQDRRSDSDMLKTMITQQSLRINAKYLPTYELTDCINYLFTSNHPDAFFLEDYDRRYFIHEVVAGPMSQDFYNRLDHEFKRGNLAAHVFHWLLRRDVTKFNPNARAFKTQARDRMLEDGRSDLASWVRGLLGDPSGVLHEIPGVPLRDLWTAKELLAFYDGGGNTKVTAGGLGRELRRAGIQQVYKGGPLKAPDGSQGRYYAIRHGETWLRADYKTCVEHLVKCQGGRGAKF